METGYVTTPFGRRPMTLALVERQRQTMNIPAGKSIDKWRVLRDISDARTILGVQDRALAILNALLSFYPRQELSEQNGLIVFPSNAQLEARANGITGTTLRKNIAALVNAGLILRKDSPNGKRYARKGDDGQIDEAFGFSLAPLLARAEEFASMAQHVAAERRRFRQLKDDVSVRRRDIRKLISAALDENAPGDWTLLEARYRQIASSLPRKPSFDILTAVRGEFERLQEDVLNALTPKDNVQKNDGNAAAFGCHIQNSKSESTIELEPSFEQSQGGRAATNASRERDLDVYPLGLVLRACPDVSAFGPGGNVETWRDLAAAAVTLRSMLGVSPSAYEDACEVMGQGAASTVIACIYERSAHINSAGGYLRDLTAKARAGQFSLGPMLMAALRANGGHRHGVM